MEWIDWLALYRFQRKRYGAFRAFRRSFRKDLRRTNSRQLLAKYINPEHRGLELGSGETTIAPIRQTILSDGYESHAGAKSLAKEFFPAERIPYPDGYFDFLLNEHVLEHLPDPILGLKEWKRVLRTNGILFISMPHPARTFDRDREITTLDHIKADHDNKVKSDEDHHWPEWKEKVLDAGLAAHYQAFSKEETLKNNLIHRHVFLPDTLAELLESLGFEVLEKIDPAKDRFDTFILVVRKR